jgi:uncharacterized protein YhbP (UPF0306 family)
MDLNDVIRDYLPTVIHMSLATSKDNKPWVSELHFAFDDDLNLYYRSLTSRRHSEEIATNPKVAGNVVKQHVLGEQVLGIYFEGIAKKLSAGPEQALASKLIEERLQASDTILEEAQQPDGHQFYKITVETFYIFGNLDNAGNNKYEVVWNGGKK